MRAQAALKLNNSARKWFSVVRLFFVEEISLYKEETCVQYGRIYDYIHRQKIAWLTYWRYEKMLK